MPAGVRDSFTTQLNGGGGYVSQQTPPSLSEFLTQNEPDQNENRKFPSSSPNASVFGRLKYDFTPTDSSVLELSDSVKMHLEKMPRFLKDWQAEDMRNRNVGGYYKNPVGDVVSLIYSALDQICSAILVSNYVTGTGNDATVPSTTYVSPLSTVFSEATVAASEALAFLAHTNRVSGVTPQTDSLDSSLPHYDQIVSVGRSLLYICNQTDTILNTAPMIGAMTSIFIRDMLVSNSSIISTDLNTIKSSIKSEVTTSGDSDILTVTSNLNSTQIDSIISNFRVVKNLLQKRRNHDVYFWSQALKIVKEQQMFINMNNAGAFNNFMVSNYIGSTKLKTSLNIPDNPKPFEKQVIVSETGRITVYNKTTGEIIRSDSDLEQIVSNFEPTDTIITGVFDQGTAPETRDVVVEESTSQILELDEFIEFYNANTLVVTVDNNQLNVTPGSIVFDTLAGVWSDYRTIQVTNVNDNVYYYSNETTSYNFTDSEVEIEVQDSTKRRGIVAVSIANTGNGYSNGTVVITGGGTDNIAATITVSNNAISGAIVSVNIVSAGSYSSVPVINVSSLKTGAGSNNANLIALLGQPTNSIANGESFNVLIRFRSLEVGNTVEYGYFTIDPGITFRVKGYSNVTNSGILLPSVISTNVGNSTNKVFINQFNGPYEILDSEATGVEKWTFRNLNQNAVTILSVIETTNLISTNNNTHMNVQLYQASVPNTINVNDSVLWYANVKPLVEFPNSSTFLVTTSDGQQRTLTIGIDRGIVDDSNLYNEVVNSSPTTIVTTAPFTIRVFGGKPNTTFSYTGPSLSGTGTIAANGFANAINTTITSTGSYTFTFNFDGTNHRRTLTKVITS